MRASLRDLGAGALFLSIGLFFALNALFKLSIGTAYSMGPGFFPVGLGALLCCFGLFILAKGLRSRGEDVGPIPWRGAGFVLGSVLFFALAIGPLGALPAVAGSSFLAAVAPGDSTWRSAAVIAAALTAFCIAVFIHALGLPYPLIGPWLSGR